METHTTGERVCQLYTEAKVEIPTGKVLLKKDNFFVFFHFFFCIYSPQFFSEHLQIILNEKVTNFSMPYQRTGRVFSYT